MPGRYSDVPVGAEQEGEVMGKNWQANYTLADYCEACVGAFSGRNPVECVVVSREDLQLVLKSYHAHTKSTAADGAHDRLMVELKRGR